MEKGKYWLSTFLLLVVLTSSVYFVLDDNLRIDIKETYSDFSVYEDGKWVLAGREYVNLFDGTAKMRASERNINVETFGNDTIVTRTAQYKNNILVVETYIFQSNTSDITIFPVSHDIMVIGADRPERPYILQYEVQQLLYTGETINNVQSPQSFGHQMKVEWEDGNYYSRIFKYSGKDEGKLTVKYRIDSDRFEKNVRLFDPPGQNLTIPFGDTQSLGGNLVYDNVFIYGTLNINGTDYLNITADYIFINGTVDGTTLYNGGARGESNGGSVGVGSIGTGIKYGYPGTGQQSGDYSAACGGGGGGGAVSGSNGVSDSSGIRVCTGGSAGGQAGTTNNNYDRTVWSGSGGAGGTAASAWSSDTDGGTGGAGAGWLSIKAQDIYISGSILLNGDNGGTAWTQNPSYAGSGGGGAGSGGTILIQSISLNISNSILNVAGGGAGAGTGNSFYTSGTNGGSGAGGRIKIFSIFLENDSTTITKGTGSYFYNETNDFDVLLLSPLQDALISNPVNFTCQSLSGEDLTLNIDGIPNITIEDGLISEEISVSDGSHNFSCNTSTFNPYTSYFVVDTTPPTLEELTPVDNYISDTNYNIFTINMTDTQVTLGKVDLWTNEDGTWAFRETNTSANGLTNANVSFNRSIDVKFFEWGLYYCDNLSNCQFTENRTLVIDHADPVISITYPQNVNYITNVSDLNYTIFDDYPNYCWYSMDYGMTNSTSVSSGTNFTNITSSIGLNTATIYCNDTRGNIGSAYVTYTLDAIRYSSNSDATNASVSGVGSVFINVTVNPIINKQNISFRGFSLTNSSITQYLSNDFTNSTNLTTLVSTTSPFYWDVILYDTNNISYILNIRYKVMEDVNFSMEEFFNNIIVELGADIDINATSDTYYVYVDVDHPDYGINYSSGFLATNFELIIDYFRKTIFNDSTISKVLEFVGTQVMEVFFPAHQYDEVDAFSFNISGINHSGYPENIQINKTNTTLVDRLFPGFLIGDLIHLYTLNTMEYNKTIYYSNPASSAIMFFVDDGATFNQLTFDISGFLFGFFYTDEFNDESVLDPVLNEGMFRGGFALPGGTDLTSFVYDTFLPTGAIDATFWSATANGFYDGGKDGSGNDDGYDVTVTNSYNGGLIIDTYMDEDFDVGETGTRSFTNEAFTNTSKFNIWTAQELDFIMEYSNSATRSNSARNCYINPKAEIGTKAIFTAPWLVCEDDNDADCTTTSDTIEPLNFSLVRNIDNSWNVTVSGTTETYASDYDNDDCGWARWTYNYTNGSLTKDYQNPGSPCRDDDHTESLSNKWQVSDLNWNTGKQFRVTSVLYGSYHGEDNDGCETMFSLVNVSSMSLGLYNISNSSIISGSVFESGGPLTEATARVSIVTFPPGTNAYLYLSVDGGATWENVYNGVEYQFLATGTDMRYKIEYELSTDGYITEIPAILNISIETPSDYPSSLTFDFGDDGVIDATFDGSLNLTNSPHTITISSANLSSIFSSYSPFDHLFQVPLDIYSSTVGELYIDNFNLTYNPNPVVLDDTYISNYLTNSINFVDFPISIEATNGNITIDDVRYDYAGGNDTIEITSYSAPVPIYTTYNTFNNSLTEENLTFTGNENFTRWLSILEDTVVQNAYLNLTGHSEAGWNLSTATYDSVSLSTQDTFPTGLFFKPDGTRLYEVGSDADKFYQYSCSEAWNLSSCSYDSINISTQGVSTSDMYFSSDGTRLYGLEPSFSGSYFYQYSCSEAWNLSSCSYDNVNITAQDDFPIAFTFKADGTKLYESGSFFTNIFQYTCTDAWNLSSCSYDNINIAPATPNSARGLSFKPDGTKMYSLESSPSSSNIFQYTCTDAWNLSSCSYDNINITTSVEYSNDLFFKPDGVKLYEIGRGSDKFYQYSLDEYTNNTYISIDQTKVWSYIGEFKTTDKTSNFASSINSYISTATAIGGYYLVPFTFHSDTAGILEYSSIDVMGTVDTIYNSLTRYITYYYSRWDYAWIPKNVEWIYFAPTSPIKQNVTPYGQTSSTPILNITNYGYGGKDATLSILQDSNLSCVETTISLDNNKSNGFLLTTNWTELTNLSYLEATDVWLWADYSCDYSTWRNFQPNYYFRQCVDGGICSTDLI